VPDSYQHRDTSPLARSAVGCARRREAPSNQRFLRFCAAHRSQIQCQPWIGGTISPAIAGWRCRRSARPGPRDPGRSDWERERRKTGLVAAVIGAPFRTYVRISLTVRRERTSDIRRSMPIGSVGRSTGWGNARAVPIICTTWPQCSGRCRQGEEASTNALEACWRHPAQHQKDPASHTSQRLRSLGQPNMRDAGLETGS
jgi:hypothetical protein